MLDPARPRTKDARSGEMQPNLPECFRGLKPYLASTSRGPCIVLDLSPRLTQEPEMALKPLLIRSGQALSEPGHGCRGGGRGPARTLAWRRGNTQHQQAFCCLSRTFGGEDNVIEQRESAQIERLALQTARRNECDILDALWLKAALLMLGWESN